MKSFDQQFTDWVAGMPADRVYDYEAQIPERSFDGCGCALYQFLAASGYPVKAVGPWDWRERDTGISHPLPQGLDDILRAKPYTFGALAERLVARADPTS